MESRSEKGAGRITGSIITSKFVKAGDRVRFDLEQLGNVELQVD